MAKATASKPFLWLVAIGFVGTIVLMSTVFSSIDHSAAVRCDLSLFLYLKVDKDKDPTYHKPGELFSNYHPADKVTPSVMLPTATPLQQPVAEHKSSTTPLNSTINATRSHPTTPRMSRDTQWSSSRTPPALSPKPSPELSARERSYVLSLDIAQQISGALHGYTDLATLGALLNLSTVEPYTVSTSLVGVPNVKQQLGQTALELSEIYDFDMLKSVLKTCSESNDHQMSNFETFLKRASREVIFVYMLTSLNIGKRFSFTSNRTIIAIDKRGNVTQKALERLNRWAVHVSPSNSSGFHVSHAFVIDAQPKKALHLSEILDVLGPAIRRNVARLGSATVLLNNWEGIHNKPDSANFYYIPEFVQRHCRSSIYKVNHSQSVVNTAQFFAQSLRDNYTKTRIGVHIRGERLLNLHQESFVICLNKLKDLINSYNDSQVRLIHDLSKYGTRTCFGLCELLRYFFASKISELDWPSVHFYPDVYTHIPHNPAFVAAVEQEYLSRMDVLVTVGSGGFQTSTITKFMQHADRNRNHLYKICSNKFDDSKDLIQVF